MNGWSPFDEAVNHLYRYKLLFPRDEVFDTCGDHPQMFEEWLDTNCHNNYCYAWVWSRKGDFSTNIVNQLVGVPENLVMAVKLMSGIDPFTWDDFNVGEWPVGSGFDRFKIYDC